jgi:hypothetical protein
MRTGVLASRARKAAPVASRCGFLSVRTRHSTRKGHPMGKNNLHNPDSMQFTQNQNNQMSEDPRDGSRDSFTLGEDGATPAERKPPHDRQDQARIEAFGRAGAAAGEQD